MHEPVREHLEDYLEGKLRPEAAAAIQSHLASCQPCTEVVAHLRFQSTLIRNLRVPAEVEPPPGFYARVMQRIDAQGRPSFWSLLLDPVFGRRLVYGTASLVVLMTAYLFATAPVQQEMVQTPAHFLASPSPAQPALPGPLGSNPQQERDSILVTLTTFSE
jgi:anti-sigma factor RsiW